MASLLENPTPLLLHRLSGGQLINRFERSIRLWYMVQQMYGNDGQKWRSQITEPFRYKDFSEKLFASSHNLDTTAKREELSQLCANTSCICQQSALEILQLTAPTKRQRWLKEVSLFSGLDTAELTKRLEIYPFRVSHRSLQMDLKMLEELGWLKSIERGSYGFIPEDQLPNPERDTHSSPGNDDDRESVDFAHILEDIAFLQGHLHLRLDELETQLKHRQVLSLLPRRILVHFEHIIPEDHHTSDRIGDHQACLEKLWRSPKGGIVRFRYRVFREQGREADVIVYPVCLHYVRRAKYLSAYGIDPWGKVAWYNYRLDAIASSLEVLPQGSELIPETLRQMSRQNNLPTTEDIVEALLAAWGFDFYLPKLYLILRFPEAFERWYVRDSYRHETFQRLDPGQLRQVLDNPELVAPQERQQIEALLARYSDTDNHIFYGVWVRWPDPNLVLRLRDWGPNGEVIAPLVVRHHLRDEVRIQSNFYG
ncbi:TIGR03985 family CRISPR-associated protein [Picosynechococcus sp. NKBG042902]|uniref:TIGR03985 family CRISPR-associated protein n=1 Tax=Picosynechococcus sp. NKBG042902 TaxID=490193 RepID=UPI0004AB7049|nr:TIGR03985 family CRISPR-associated protein [Picosynechococcus sp. NKBG042902]